MATMFPSSVTSAEANGGERFVFSALKDGVGAEHWTVLHSLNLSRHVYQHMGEIDFVVLMPGKGILVLEVKGGDYVAFDGNEWTVGQGPKRYTSKKGPFVQAKDNMFSLRDNYVRAQVPELGGMAFGYCVVLPHCASIKHPSPEWEPWHLVSAEDLAKESLPQLLLKVMDRWRDKMRSGPSTSRIYNDKLPTRQQVSKLVTVLRPQFEVFEPPASRAVRRDAEIKRYTEEQFGALDSMSDNPRTLFAGPAGTGKTLLAMEAANRALGSGKRVWLTCFNRPLAERLKALMPAHPNLTINTLQGHMMTVTGLTFDTTYDQTFWNHTLPSRACDALLVDTTGQFVFDEVIVDEAQDLLREPFVDFIDLSVKGGLRAGRLRFFGDFDKQAIYGVTKEELEGIRERRLSDFARCRLYANCRNPKLIAERVMAWVDLDPGYTRILRSDESFGPPQLIEYDDAIDQAESLADVLEQLIARGTTPDDIVILSPKAADACHGRLTDSWRDRLTPLERSEPGKIRYSTIHRFKGLEAPIVILTDLDAKRLKGERNLLYVGMTRTLERLILLVEEGARDALKVQAMATVA